MRYKLQSIRSLNKLNVEKAVIFNFIFRISQIFTQLLLIVTVSKYFSPVELGYFYVLNSYAGMAIFFELGLANVIMQHAAHESAAVKREDFFSNNATYGKLTSLFHFTLKWFAIASILFVVLIYSSSFYFFDGKGKGLDSNIHWHMPLFILMLSIAISSFVNGIYSFLEGCLFIKEVSLLRFIQNLIFILLFVSFVLFHFGILAYGLAQGISLIVTIIVILYLKIFKVVKNIFSAPTGKLTINWMQDVFPLQWRIALSAISGYFIYQITDLFAFKFQGPVISGQYGFTMSILNGIMVVSTVWTSSRAPIYANLVAKRDILSLQKLFKKTFLSILFTFLFFIISFFIFKLIVVDHLHFLFYKRFLGNQSMLILSCCVMITACVGGIAAYCRANREEPFLVTSVFGAVWCTIMGFWVLKFYTINVFCVALLMTNILIGIPWAFWIYKTSKRKLFKLLN